VEDNTGSMKHSSPRFGWSFKMDSLGHYWEIKKFNSREFGRETIGNHCKWGVVNIKVKR